MNKIFLIALLFTWGCSTISTQTTETFMHLDSGKATNYKTMTLTDVNAFAPTTTVKFVLHCEPTGHDNDMPRCRPSDVGSKDTTAGVVTGFGSALVNSAAIVGGSYFIGKGIGNSGDINTTGDIIGDDAYNTYEDSYNSETSLSTEDNSETYDTSFSGTFTSPDPTP